MGKRRIGKYKFGSKSKEADLSILDGGPAAGNLSGLTAVESSTAQVPTGGNLVVGTNLKGGTNAADNTFVQFDGTEVARIHDGGVVPTASGDSTSLTAGTGFGNRRRVITIDSSNDDNVLTLTSADSGAIIFVFATNGLNINLPAVGTETGMWFTIIVGDKDNKALTVKTSGQDGADNIILQNTLTVAETSPGTTADLGGSDHDVLTLGVDASSGLLEGSKVELLNFVGGTNELWLANVISTDTVAPTIA